MGSISTPHEARDLIQVNWVSLLSAAKQIATQYIESIANQTRNVYIAIIIESTCAPLSNVQNIEFVITFFFSLELVVKELQGVPPVGFDSIGLH